MRFSIASSFLRIAVFVSTGAAFAGERDDSVAHIAFPAALFMPHQIDIIRDPACVHGWICAEAVGPRIPTNVHAARKA
jgi:hypothetical protein